MVVGVSSHESMSADESLIRKQAAETLRQNTRSGTEGREAHQEADEGQGSDAGQGQAESVPVDQAEERWRVLHGC